MGSHFVIDSGWLLVNFFSQFLYFICFIFAIIREGAFKRRLLALLLFLQIFLERDIMDIAAVLSILSSTSLHPNGPPLTHSLFIVLVLNSRKAFD